MKKQLSVAMCFAAVFAFGQVKEPDALKARIEALQAGGAKYLLAKQMPNGAWMRNPAITALAIVGLMDAPGVDKGALEKGIAYIASCSQPQGTILDPQDRRTYPVYSTSICLLALVKAARPQDAAIIRNARDYLLSVDPTPEDSDAGAPAKAGFGYGKRHRADLNNTAWVLEALAATDNLDREPFNKDPQKAQKAELAWGKALAFISSCQNLSETNKSAWLKSAPEDDKGGFIYCPEDALRDNADARMLRSYGSMTYSGLKSLIYAKVKPEDVRVKAALDWIAKYYTLDENPGVGQAGYYYYLHTFAKTLTIMKLNSLRDAKGTGHDWRSELVLALEKRQNKDGSWHNDKSGRWWESMQELSTSYVLMTLGCLEN